MVAENPVKTIDLLLSDSVIDDADLSMLLRVYGALLVGLL